MHAHRDIFQLAVSPLGPRIIPLRRPCVVVDEIHPAIVLTLLCGDKWGRRSMLSGLRGSWKTPHSTGSEGSPDREEKKKKSRRYERKAASLCGISLWGDPNTSPG